MKNTKLRVDNPSIRQFKRVVENLVNEPLYTDDLWYNHRVYGKVNSALREALVNDKLLELAWFSFISRISLDKEKQFLEFEPDILCISDITLSQMNQELSNFIEAMGFAKDIARECVIFNNVEYVH